MEKNLNFWVVLQVIGVFCSLLSNIAFTQNNINDINFHIESFWLPQVDTLKNVEREVKKFYFVNANSDTTLKETQIDEYNSSGMLTKRSINKLLGNEATEYSIKYFSSKIQEIIIMKKIQGKTEYGKMIFNYKSNKLERIDHFSNKILNDFTEFQWKNDTLFVIQYDSKISYEGKYKIIRKRAYRYNSQQKEIEFLNFIEYLPNYHSYSLLFEYNADLHERFTWILKEGKKTLSHIDIYNNMEKMFYRKRENGTIEKQIKYVFDSKNNWIECSGKIDFDVNLIKREITHF